MAVGDQEIDQPHEIKKNLCALKMTDLWAMLQTQSIHIHICIHIHIYIYVLPYTFICITVCICVCILSMRHSRKHTCTRGSRSHLIW